MACKICKSFIRDNILSYDIKFLCRQTIVNNCDMIVNELTRLLLNIPEDICKMLEKKYVEEVKYSVHKSVVLVEILEEFANEDLVHLLSLMEDRCIMNTSMVRRCVGQWLTDLWILSAIHKDHLKV